MGLDVGKACAKDQPHPPRSATSYATKYSPLAICSASLAPVSPWRGRLRGSAPMPSAARPSQRSPRPWSQLMRLVGHRGRHASRRGAPELAWAGQTTREDFRTRQASGIKSSHTLSTHTCVHTPIAPPCHPGTTLLADVSIQPASTPRGTSTPSSSTRAYHSSASRPAKGRDKASKLHATYARSKRGTGYAD